MGRGKDYEDEAPAMIGTKPLGRHITKRSLKNKALAVSFNEKDLKDYVTGFHKRKKKRRKEAEKKQEQAERRKRIERRKKRKLEKEYVQYGGALPRTDSVPDGIDEDNEDEEEREPAASVSGTKMYDGGNMTVTVITSEISREEEEDLTSEKTHTTMPKSVGDKVDKKRVLPVSKSKPFKRVAKHRSKTPTKREKNKTRKGNKTMR